MKIKKISAREILDSRGNPTVECSIELGNGMIATASVPSGASVGKHEAVELRDGDPLRYNGKGVLRAVEAIEKIIAPELLTKSPDVCVCDKIMLELDGTINKSNLGANAILAVSMAVARAQSFASGEPLYRLLQEISGTDQVFVPQAMFNILNGGVHADNKMDFQEFMIMPVRQEWFADLLHMSVLIYHKLKALLRAERYSTGVGDEGGFAPRFVSRKRSRERQALDFLLKATEEAGFEPGKDVVFCLDVAASHFYNNQEKVYLLNGEKLMAYELIDEYKQLIDEYPIYSIEDGLDEDDWDGWRVLTEELDNKVLLVGDDIFVSNPKRIMQGVANQVANAVLIKPNQIGSVTECLAAITVCKANHYKPVVSHRSGETLDTFIVDLAVGTNSRFIKAGAPSRGERVAKYNWLLDIERLL